jgi:hypothetical protein
MGIVGTFRPLEKVAIKPIPVSDRDSMYWMLRHGLGDIIAAQQRK